MGGHILGTMHTDPQRGEVAGLESSVVAPSRRIPFFTAASLSNPPATPSATPSVSALAPPSPPPSPPSPPALSCPPPPPRPGTPTLRFSCGDCTVQVP